MTRGAEVFVASGLIVFGLVIVSPPAGRIMRLSRDWWYSVFPWYSRLPGARRMYSDKGLHLTQVLMGSFSGVLGALILLGTVSFK
jgi:hypothetical protein